MNKVKRRKFPMGKLVLSEAEVDRVFSKVCDRNPAYQKFLQEMGLKELRDRLRRERGPRPAARGK